VDERAVRAAAARIGREAHGLFMGTGEPCSMVPVSALDDLAEAVHGERPPPPGSGLSRLVEANRKLDAVIATPDGVSTDRPPVT
jgi:hypothetical protein